MPNMGFDKKETKPASKAASESDAPMVPKRIKAKIKKDVNEKYDAAGIVSSRQDFCKIAFETFNDNAAAYLEMVQEHEIWTINPFKVLEPNFPKDGDYVHFVVTKVPFYEPKLNLYDKNDPDKGAGISIELTIGSNEKTKKRIFFGFSTKEKELNDIAKSQLPNWKMDLPPALVKQPEDVQKIEHKGPWVIFIGTYKEKPRKEKDSDDKTLSEQAKTEPLINNNFQVKYWAYIGD